MAFAGQADITIDAKGRLAVPSKFRAELDRQGWRASWKCLPWPNGTIRLYPESVFDRIASSLEDKLVPNEDEERLLQALFGMAETAEADSAGRIRLSGKLLRSAQISAEATVVGSNSFLVVHDRQRWEEQERSVFEQLPDLVRAVTRKDPSPAARNGATGGGTDARSETGG